MSEVNKFRQLAVTRIFLGFVVFSITACTPTESDNVASESSTVKIGQSASVRINGQPIVRAVDGAAMLALECEGARQSQNVRINGSAATIMDAGSANGCQPSSDQQASSNVRVGN